MDAAAMVRACWFNCLKLFSGKLARLDGIELPEEFGVGMVFLQRGREAEAADAIRQAVEKFDLSFVGWRAVPTDPSILGPRSCESLPVIRQCFVAPHYEVADSEAFDFALQLLPSAATPGDAA